MKNNIPLNIQNGEIQTELNLKIECKAKKKYLPKIIFCQIKFS